MSITIKEIAQIAGVGRATVDRALKGRGNIKEKTKIKILQIAKEFDYKPNTVGKALVYAKNKYKIGFVINSVGNAFFDKIIDGINDALSEIADFGFEGEFELLKCYDVEQQLNAINKTIERGAKCIIITPINNDKIIEKLRDATKVGLQVVTLNIDIDLDEKLAYIGCDYLKSGKTAGNLISLLSGESTNLLIVTGSCELMGHRLRIEGIKDEVKKLPLITIANIIENNDDEVESYIKIRDELNKNRSINFVCITAGGAKGAMLAITECASNIKVITFDDTPEIRQFVGENKILATITQQPYVQGYSAVKIIFNHIVNKTKVEKDNFTELNIKIRDNI